MVRAAAHPYPGACGIEIVQCRNHRLSRFRIRCHRAHDAGDRFRIIGTDQKIVLDIQQWSVLQLTRQPAAIPKIFMQAPGKQRQRVAVPDLRCRAKAFVQSTANNAVMIDQRKRFVGDDCFELILGRAGARDVCCSRVGRNMIDPVPTQCVMVNLEFARRPLDRCTGGEKPFDPRAFEVIASLTASRPRTLSRPIGLPRLCPSKNLPGRKGFLPTKIANL
jgi:hypothetical protein